MIYLIVVIDIDGKLRGIYVSVVFDFHLDNNINFDYGISISTKSTNIASFFRKIKMGGLKTL